MQISQTRLNGKYKRRKRTSEHNDRKRSEYKVIKKDESVLIQIGCLETGEKASVSQSLSGATSNTPVERKEPEHGEGPNHVLAFIINNKVKHKSITTHFVEKITMHISHTLI